MAKKKEAKKKELAIVSEELINGARIVTYEDGSVDIFPAVVHLTADQASVLCGSDDGDWEDSDDDEDEDEDDDEEGFDFGDEETTIYEVECACGEIIDFDEEVLEKGSRICPNCGEKLEFDRSSLDEEPEENGEE